MLGKMGTSYLEGKLNTKVNIEKIDISFFKFIKLEEVYVEDLHQDTLFYIQNLKTEIDFFKFKGDSLKIHLGRVQIENPTYILQQSKGDSFTNLSFLIDAFSSSDTSSSSTNVIINSSNVIVSNGHFVWDNDNYEIEEFGIDWDHTELNNINLDLTHFKMINDSFMGDFQHFSWIEKSGFEVTNFTGNATFSSTITQVDNLHILSPYSDINVDLLYEYDSIGSYVDFNNQVYMRYALDTSIVNFKDIAYFSSTLEGMDYEVTLFGKEKGPVSQMKFQDIYLKYGEESVVYGRVFITGLPEIEATSFNCNFKELSTNYADLATIKTYPFTSGKKIEIPHFITNAGKMEFKGRFNGYYNDFVTNGTFRSNNGIVKTDLQLVPQNSGTIHYKGGIKTTNFDLASMTNLPEIFGKTSIDVEVVGDHLDFENMDLKLKGKATKFDFKGYTYTNLTTDLTIKDEKISGVLSVLDTNLNLQFDGSISLHQSEPIYQFSAKIDHLRPNQLHLLDRDSSASLSTEVIFNFQGNSLDNIIGRAGLHNFEFSEYDEKVELKTVDFLGFTSGKDKTLSLHSDNIDLQITGQFYLEELLQSLNHVVYKWLPSIYKGSQLKPQSVENFRLVLHAHRFSGFSSIFLPQITFKNDLNLELGFNSEIEKIDLIVKSSNMNLMGQEMKGMDVNAILTTDTFQLHSNIENVLFTDSNYIENVSIKSEAHENNVQTMVKWDNLVTDNQNSGEVKFDLNFMDPNNFSIEFLDSWVVVNDTLWDLHDSSKITKSFKEYSFKNIALSQNEQDFMINGFISEDPQKELRIEVDSFNLRHLNPVFKKFKINLTGKLNGTTTIKDFYNEFQLHSDLKFSDLTFNHQTIGNGLIKSTWDTELEKFDVDVGFLNKNFNTIGLTGAYYPKKRKEKLDLLLSLDHFPVKIIEPFFLEYIDDISGTISGKSTITGTFKEPKFKGDFTLNEVETRVVYLNEKLFTSNQSFFIRPNLIGADAVLITDSDKKKAQVNFSLFHSNFEDINFDLAITSLDVFRAFNTTSADNEYFYGTVHLNPGSTIGMESDYQGNINLVANVVTGPETQVVIPFFEDDEVTKREYIYFVSNKTDSSKIEVSTKNDEATDFTMDMAMELSENAEIQLIFDEFTNDKIQARGAGNITVKIDKNEDFSIYGNYEISEGFYLFTFSKVISKKFDINKGSRLTWNGDPYKGQADIQAAYNVRTTLLELGITGTYDSTELTKRVPVEVLLTMTGNYMDPLLSFSFTLPPKYTEIETLLNNLDEGERNKQVFALLILNKFLPITGASVSSGSSLVATNSSELLSNQLSSWLSKISNDFDFGFRYNPGDDITADEVEVALSTQIFNDRILIETNVGISSNTSASSTNSNTIVGEFTISYKINKKGNIVGKVFNRSNELNPVYQNYSPYTQGIGIAYSEPFKNSDNLGCILSNHLKKSENKRDCEKEYYDKQKENKEANLIKTNRMVARNRRKSDKRKAKELAKKAKSTN
tara:strand:- start:28932 stop:33419 length:4488 start_codon:yes stop_codon:yes gene_type:complete